MARVRDVEIHEVPEDVRPVYERFAREYGPFLNQVKVFAHRPPALKHIMGLLLDFADEAILPKRYLEIALVVVSKLNACEYCVIHHAPRLVDQFDRLVATQHALRHQRAHGVHLQDERGHGEGLGLDVALTQRFLPSGSSRRSGSLDSDPFAMAYHRRLRICRTSMPPKTV